MKALGILFTAPMVRAILAGTKTQTRRIAKAPKGYEPAASSQLLAPRLVCRESPDVDPNEFADEPVRYISAPHGPVGRRLWVRETFALSCADPEQFDDRDLKNPADWDPPVYRATATSGEWEHYDGDGNRTKIPPLWKPAIHMPRWASRITLEVTRVRLERVQSITEDDARAEGVVGEPCDHVRQSCEDIGCCGPTARGMYGALWDEINGKPKLSRGGKAKNTAYPWASNPCTGPR